MPNRQPSQPGGGDLPRRRPGRPARSAAEREAAKERRIPRSQQGRLKFRPGDPHALDAQMLEARNYRRLIAERLTQLRAALAALDASEPATSIDAEEEALKAFLWETYQAHKHRDHIAATMLAIRRQRLLERLEAAGAALDMAADLLAPNERLLQELRAAVAHQQATAERRRQQPRTQPPAQDQEEAGPRVDHRHLYGDTKQARARLAQFEERVETIRAAMSQAIGWFEEFFIKKVRITAAAREYAKRGEKIPEDVPTHEEIWYGPYLKYRWQEATGGPQYTIQMGMIPADELAAAEAMASGDGEEVPQGEQDEDDGAPWPHL